MPGPNTTEGTMQQGNGGTDADPITNLDFADEEYEIRQSLIRNKYNVYNAGGDLVLKAKQKLFKMKEDFPFVDPDGEEVFRVKAQNVLDIAGDYAVVDAASGEVITTLHKDFTWFRHSWKVKDPDSDEVLATITSRSLFFDMLRTFSDLFSLFPHKYTIDTQGGEQIGVLEGKFSIRDVYKLRVGETGSIPREAVLASAIAVDALEGN
ncbi:MAG: LURP-one-related family protein [Candidatus Nanohaloarchaea archaeon]|nr:LURP-one-related family protein [Candidatus Nanohaloarchaea archaeon]